MASAPDPGLVVTRTPLRVSFAGGGTDLEEFYSRESGAVFSTAISRYVYVSVKRHGPVFDEQVRVTYSTSEMVGSVDAIQNDIARECLRFLGVEPPIYISTIGDLPDSSGLGG
jgi:D-glycero-alpha-D-manno-heptose-7-phosphate kinase